MENIPLPSKVEITPGAEKNTATVSIHPCHPGFGTTIGNALRRVLLSSLPGGAVTAFKIKGVSHEFAAIDNVLEDVVEISLNLKQLRLRVNSTEPVRLHLHAKGEKKVTAKDIEPNADVDVISTDLLIATLTSKTAEIDMDIVVSQGRGYVPSEAREKENTENDMIVIDSIFTPIRNVGIHVENIRVGQMTNYENLILDIETDGSVSPEQAVAQSTQILLSHFNFIADNTSLGEVKVKKVKAEKSEGEDDEAEVEEKKEKKAKKESKKKEDK